MENHSHISDYFPINDLMVDFQVRNAKDPLLVAQNLTDQTLNFGLSKDDLIIIGLLLLFISVCLAIRPIIFLRTISCVPDYRNVPRYQESAQSTFDDSITRHDCNQSENRRILDSRQFDSANRISPKQASAPPKLKQVPEHVALQANTFLRTESLRYYKVPINSARS